MFKGQPKGLFALALANTGERFGYYTMLAIFLLFLQAKFGFSASAAGQFYAIFLAAVYFMPVLGGWLADKIGYGKCVITGVAVMFVGYVCLALPTSGTSAIALPLMIGALLLIAVGTGLFKGNLQVMVGNLYDDPKYSAKRDSAFSLFYMAINLGSMFAPTAATALTNSHLAKAGLIYKADIPALAHQYLDGTLADTSVLQGLQAMMPGADVAAMETGEFCRLYIDQLSVAYNMGFAVACVSLIFSIAIYLACRPWFRHADVNTKQAAAEGTAAVELTPKQTRDRIVALCWVFAVVIFFWMAFHQNGSSLTYFARDYTQTSVAGPVRIGFNIWPLALIAISIYTLFGIFQSESGKGKLGCGVATAALWAGAYALYSGMDATISILPQQFQQFNPFFVVALTPVSMAIFGALAAKGKEPSAPKKIGLGMFVAAVGYFIMLFASKGQPAPSELASVGGVSPDPVVPMYLISTYLVLTFAELLLSPMGISFVSKVAPPKYKGLMMGLWFAATAVGNYLSSIPSMLWNNVPLWVNWSILMALCLISGIVMFSMLRKLEAATA
ncbi:MAG: peptide MFS transporter [Bacteroidales bacterium]|nr:peptide MFS transporter [Candidatus Cryptobacteroides aphodequi]